MTVRVAHHLPHLPHPRRPGRAGFHAPKLLLGVAVVVLIVLTTLYGPDRATIDGWVTDAGAFGPVLFVLVYAALTVGAVPATVLSVAAGVLFGPVLGSVLAVAGATAGATGSFVLARGVLHDAAVRRLGHRLELLDAHLESSGLAWVIAIRLMPLLPTNVLNYAFGITEVHLRDYVLGTALGSAPAIVAIVVLGDSATDPTSARFLLSVLVLVLLAVVTIEVPRRRRRARERAASPDDAPPAGPR